MQVSLPMTDWSDDSIADPVADLQAWAKLITDDAGVYPTTIHVSSGTYKMYLWVKKRDEILNDLLQRTRRRNFVRRYVLQREMGHKRLSIIFPRLARSKFNVQMRLYGWKHRNDREWW